MLILQFFGGFVVSLLSFQSASSRRPALVGEFRHTCGVPGYYKSASFRRMNVILSFGAFCANSLPWL